MRWESRETINLSERWENSRRITCQAPSVILGGQSDFTTGLQPPKYPLFTRHCDLDIFSPSGELSQCINLSTFSANNMQHRMLFQSHSVAISTFPATPPNFCRIRGDWYQTSWWCPWLRPGLKHTPSTKTNQQTSSTPSHFPLVPTFCIGPALVILSSESRSWENQPWTSYCWLLRVNWFWQLNLNFCERCLHLGLVFEATTPIFPLSTDLPNNQPLRSDPDFGRDLSCRTRHESRIWRIDQEAQTDLTVSNISAWSFVPKLPLGCPVVSALNFFLPIIFIAWWLKCSHLAFTCTKSMAMITIGLRCEPIFTTQNPCLGRDKQNLALVPLDERDRYLSRNSPHP